LALAILYSDWRGKLMTPESSPAPRRRAGRELTNGQTLFDLISSGLGLPISRSFVQLHGGQLRLESALG